MGNPGFHESDLPEDLARCYRPGERLSRSKNPCENSGTSEPAANPVVPHFPHPRISEVIIQKDAEPGRNYRTITDGNGGGHIWRYYEGRKEEGMWFGTWRVPPGGYAGFLPGYVKGERRIFTGIIFLQAGLSSEICTICTRKTMLVFSLQARIFLLITVHFSRGIR